MGASWSSSVRESRVPMATATIAPPFPYTFKPSMNNGPTPTYRPYPEARAPLSRVPSASALAPEPPNANRIIVFHSTPTWKAFFEASKASNKLVVIDFTAAWCGPCRQMEPTLNEYASKYSDVDFVKIDVDELSSVASDYGIQAMPTFLFLKKGKEVDKVVGAKKEELQRKIEKHRF